MKKNILLLTLIAGMAFVVLQSNLSGPASGSAGNKTGAQGTTANCGGGGCHGGASASTTATIRVDSVGAVQVTQYVPGMTYTVTVTGAHTSLTHFGFQFAAVSGATSSAEVQAGTFGTSLPTQVAKHTLSGLSFIEQTSAITGPLSKVFTWTAPATGVGSIKMYLTVNAVNNDGNQDAPDVSGNVVKTLTQHIPSSAVASVANNTIVNTFPNPVINMLNVQVGNAFGSYSVQVFDLTGRNICRSTIDANATGTTTINTSNWATGLYNVVVTSETSREVVQVVKQ